MKTLPKQIIVLTVLVTALFCGQVFAGLYCFQLRRCSGQAGCVDSGSASGCKLTCLDGVTIRCNRSGQGGGGDCEPYWGGDCDEEV